MTISSRMRVCLPASSTNRPSDSLSTWRYWAMVCNAARTEGCCISSRLMGPKSDRVRASAIIRPTVSHPLTCAVMSSKATLLSIGIMFVGTDSICLVRPILRNSGWGLMPSWRATSS
ncbi:hypothetical protein D9M69_563960 [compost metagenome]